MDDMKTAEEMIKIIQEEEAWMRQCRNMYEDREDFKFRHNELLYLMFLLGIEVDN